MSTVLIDPDLENEGDVAYLLEEADSLWLEDDIDMAVADACEAEAEEMWLAGALT